MIIKIYCNYEAFFPCVADTLKSFASGTLQEFFTIYFFFTAIFPGCFADTMLSHNHQLLQVADFFGSSRSFSLNSVFRAHSLGIEAIRSWF